MNRQKYRFFLIVLFRHRLIEIHSMAFSIYNIKGIPSQKETSFHLHSEKVFTMVKDRKCPYKRQFSNTVHGTDRKMRYNLLNHNSDLIQSAYYFLRNTSISPVGFQINLNTIENNHQRYIQILDAGQILATLRKTKHEQHVQIIEESFTFERHLKTYYKLKLRYIKYVVRKIKNKHKSFTGICIFMTNVVLELSSRSTKASRWRSC